MDEFVACLPNNKTSEWICQILDDIVDESTEWMILSKFSV